MTTETERCLTCNGEGQYWTRRRDGEKEWHECPACHGTGQIAVPDEAPTEPLPATTTKAEPLPETS
jgi:DnaJ-class molecular chaperone